jgi:hypothetical protein
MCICAAPINPFEGVIVYGRRQADDYCQVRSFFEERGVLFEHADIERDPANLQRIVELSDQQDAVGSRLARRFLSVLILPSLTASCPKQSCKNYLVYLFGKARWQPISDTSA